jgi:hypothetical protein
VKREERGSEEVKDVQDWGGGIDEPAAWAQARPGRGPEA